MYIHQPPLSTLPASLLLLFLLLLLSHHSGKTPQPIRNRGPQRGSSRKHIAFSDLNFPQFHHQQLYCTYLHLYWSTSSRDVNISTLLKTGYNETSYGSANILQYPIYRLSVLAEVAGSSIFSYSVLFAYQICRKGHRMR